MTFTPPTYDDIIELLDMAVEEYGADYVYHRPERETNCAYVHETIDGVVVGCIMAYVFNKLGVSLGTLQKFEGVLAYEIYSKLYLNAKGYQRQTADDNRKIEDLLMTVQKYQDAGFPWGEAVHVGKRLS